MRNLYVRAYVRHVCCCKTPSLNTSTFTSWHKTQEKKFTGLLWHLSREPIEPAVDSEQLDQLSNSSRTTSSSAAHKIYKFRISSNSTWDHLSTTTHRVSGCEQYLLNKIFPAIYSSNTNLLSGSRVVHRDRQPSCFRARRGPFLACMNFAERFLDNHCENPSEVWMLTYLRSKSFAATPISPANSSTPSNSQP